jgi:hypothetical protein
LSFPSPNPKPDEINEAAMRLVDGVGFDALTAVRLAAAGYDVTGFAALRVVEDCGVAT